MAHFNGGIVLSRVQLQSGRPSLHACSALQGREAGSACFAYPLRHCHKVESDKFIAQVRHRILRQWQHSVRYKNKTAGGPKPLWKSHTVCFFPSKTSHLCVAEKSSLLSFTQLLTSKSFASTWNSGHFLHLCFICASRHEHIRSAEVVCNLLTL